MTCQKVWIEYQTIEERQVELRQFLCVIHVLAWRVGLKKTIVSVGQRENTLIDNQDSVGQGLFVLVKFLLE